MKEKNSLSTYRNKGRLKKRRDNIKDQTYVSSFMK